MFNLELLNHLDEHKRVHVNLSPMRFYSIQYIKFTTQYGHTAPYVLLVCLTVVRL